VSINLKNSDKETYGVKVLLFDSAAEFATYQSSSDAAQLKPGSRALIPSANTIYRKLVNGSFVLDPSGGEDL